MTLCRDHPTGITFKKTGKKAKCSELVLLCKAQTALGCEVREKCKVTCHQCFVNGTESTHRVVTMHSQASNENSRPLTAAKERVPMLLTMPSRMRRSQPT